MTQQSLAALAPRRIIILRALYLGDLLCALPAFRALRRRFPATEITLIGLPWARDLADRFPYLDRLLPFPGFPGLPEVPYEPARTEAFLAKAREAEYDLAIQLHGSGSYANDLVAALGARVSLGFGAADDDRLTVTVPWCEEERELRRCLRLVGELGAETTDTSIEFPTTIEEEQRACALLGARPTSGGPIIALHPGAKAPERRWPVEKFAALGDALGAQYRARIVLTGGPGEQELGRAIRRLMRVPPLDLTGETDLGTFAALIARLDLLVTNDTGASHMAAATRTRSVVLFGPSRPVRWAPLDDALHTAVDAWAIRDCVGDRAIALAELPIGPVLAACDQALASTGRPTPVSVSGRNGVSRLLRREPDLERVCGA
ncbi:MAG: hypothetical protein QOJ59_1242 [Thermomicrobiales bacterium]|jgi:ADP-heptose:LPS heptosyltransferase|nr:hypothetical protein [Thermomicrobiales bacterium]